MAIHALIASESALAYVISKIPVDKVIDTIEQTGKLISSHLKESFQYGLAKTKTAIESEKNLHSRI